MPTVTEAIRSFLTNTPHNAPELIARWSGCMETQVNVATERAVIMAAMATPRPLQHSHAKAKPSSKSECAELGVPTASAWICRVPPLSFAVRHG